MKDVLKSGYRVLNGAGSTRIDRSDDNREERNIRRVAWKEEGVITMC